MQSLMEKPVSTIPTPTAAAASRPAPRLSIRPPKGWAPFDLRELWQFRDLITTLAGRDLKVRYKQTALGVIWVVLQPILGAGVFSIVFGRIAKMPTDGVPPFLYSFVGMLAWNLFSGVLSRSSVCLTGNANLVSKVYFPRLVLPLSTVGSALVDYAIAAVMMFILMAIYQFTPSWQMLMLPVWTLVLLLMSLGVGLFTAALTVSYRDVQYVLPVATNILLMASPIAYSLSNVTGWLKTAVNLNPLAGVLIAFRSAALGTLPPDGWALAYSVILSVVVFWLGAISFKQMEKKFADII
jgi:lipopolysaccharide transport system permease protein